MRRNAARTPQLDVTTAGDSETMGLQQGEALRERIRGGRAVLKTLEAFQLMKPWFMPYPLFLRAAEDRAARALDGPLKHDYPEARKRLLGIARGADVSARQVYLFTAMESMLSDKTESTEVPRIGGCSALAVRASRSAAQEPVIVRNFDYMQAVQPLYSVRRTQPLTGYQSPDFTMAPFAGAVDGVNERGLAITYNYAYMTDKGKPNAPLSVLIAGALQNCATVEEAARWISSKPRWGAGILMLADADGSIASMEVSSTRAELRTPPPGEDLIFHTNICVTSRMREVQEADNAIFNHRAPAVMRGRLVHESAIKRMNRMKELVAGNSPFDLATLGKIMGDHGANNEPTDTTICVHGPLWSTTASIQMFPKSRRMRIAFDSACSAEHVEFAL